jgi:hypothetical protein
MAATEQRRRWLPWSITLLLPLLLGCRRTGELEMVVVSGTVTYQGKPIEEGEIRLVPVGDTKGPTSAGLIRDGHYEITARGGVPVGTHRVEIHGVRPVAGATPAEDRPGMAAGSLPKQQYLPKQYNDSSELKVTIEPGRSRITKDFILGDR